MTKTIVTLSLLLLLIQFGKAQEENILKYSMETKWASEVSKDQPWNVYPRPQMKRNSWTNLNGQWDYAIVPRSSDKPKKYDGKILVPFAVESALSGVKKTVGENNQLWYRRSFQVNQPTNEDRILLHFGAVDWEATVYINGNYVGKHKGGYTAFSFDITPYLKKKGEQEVIVSVWDPTDSGSQARGKQTNQPRGIWYTPVTGIWQTVWLEQVSNQHISTIKLTPDIDKSLLNIALDIAPGSKSMTAKLIAKENGKAIATTSIALSSGSFQAATELSIQNPRLWSPNDPFLYDLSVQLLVDNKVVDEVQSYFGMRKIEIGKDLNGFTTLLLNHQPLFQFGLLDQGWWPDGLYTAPTEEAMMYDVKMTKEWGFNMLRKHVKVEPATYYYNCDKMGILIWQDMPNGNPRGKIRVAHDAKEDADRPLASAIQFEAEWKEIMDQFHSFPSIIVWVPLNEGWGQYDTERLARWTKSHDPSRLVDAPSGWADRGVGDIIDVHLYPGPGMEAPEAKRVSVLGEFGGLGMPVKGHMWWDKRNWGYLTYYEQDKLDARFQQLIKDLIGLKSQGLAGAIYTQTTDVEGEVNGMMTYDREIVKFDPQKTRKWFAPLYQTAWKSLTILSDAEHEPSYWLATTNDQDNTDWLTSNFEDKDWKKQSAPFSSFNNPFLPKNHGSFWDESKTLYLRKEVYLPEIPERMYLKYYLHKASVEVYVNGKKLTDLKHEGGRKRHYATHYTADLGGLLKKGKNVIAVKAKHQDKASAFDLGVFAGSALSNKTGGSNGNNLKSTSGK
ncbi:MAG: sugar-binding domain-containing protein [Bacteroidota bacterium]